jgi:uncharacterized coiled-coil protein SlyX
LRGKAIWALGFLSFLSGLFAIHAVVLAADPTIGIEGTYQPWLIGSLTGGIPVYVYLLVSVIATLLFLGGTVVTVVNELSNKDLLMQINEKATNLENGQKFQQSVLESLKARVFLVDESLDAAKKDIAKRFGEQDKEIKQVHASLANKLDSKMADVTKQVGDGFTEQAEMLKQFHTSLVNRFNTKLAEVNEDLTKRIAKLESDTQKYAQRVNKSATTIMKQESEIEEIQSKLTRLEDEFVKPKPQLTSQSSVEDVRGIGETTGNELREMGITNVGELVLTEPAVIADKIDMSEKTVEKLQGRAQLAMVPGVTEKDLILLEDAGITNRKDLSSQDPIDLGKKINEIFKACVEEGKLSELDKPSIEEIDAWIKFVKA